MERDRGSPDYPVSGNGEMHAVLGIVLSVCPSVVVLEALAGFRGAPTKAEVIRVSLTLPASGR
jgi:hypothetical protein